MSQSFLSLAFLASVSLCIPHESYHMSSRALDIKLGLDISQNCYQNFFSFVTFVPYSIETKVTNVTNVPYSIGTKVTNVANFW